MEDRFWGREGEEKEEEEEEFVWEAIEDEQWCGCCTGEWVGGRCWVWRCDEGLVLCWCWQDVVVLLFEEEEEELLLLLLL